MMASVITTGADSLRVDAEFHHAGELAGLIWESEDTLDHPLLAYDTNREYTALRVAVPLAFVRYRRARCA